MYIIGAGLDLQTDLDLIPTENNFFPIPQSFTLIRMYSIYTRFILF